MIANTLLVLFLLAATMVNVVAQENKQTDKVAPPRPREIVAAVNGGLQWLAKKQVKEGAEKGSWPSSNRRYKTAVTSLAGLAFLANGHLPDKGRYGEEVRQALEYVIKQQNSEGYLGGGDVSGMYIHAICMLFALSCFGELENPEDEVELAEWCQKGVEVIVKAQSVSKAADNMGGWRYTPRTTESDTSVTCWQLFVLHSARQCGIEVEDAVIQDALGYVNRAFVTPETEGIKGDHAGFLYLPTEKKPELAVSGVALAVKSVLEGELDWRCKMVLKNDDIFEPAWGGDKYAGYFYFTLFYMTQGIFQVGGEKWNNYKNQLASVLIENQAGDGHWPFPSGSKQQSKDVGTSYATAMSILALSLDKQYLPMYQRQRELFSTSIKTEED